MSTSIHSPRTLPQPLRPSPDSRIIQSLQRMLLAIRDNKADSILVMTRRPHERCLTLLFLLSLVLLNPWVRGDGVGYYAFARALLIQHNLDFAPDYAHANQTDRKSV